MVLGVSGCGSGDTGSDGNHAGGSGGSATGGTSSTGGSAGTSGAGGSSAGGSSAGGSSAGGAGGGAGAGGVAGAGGANGPIVIAAVGDINGPGATGPSSNPGRTAQTIRDMAPTYFLGLGDFQYSAGTTSEIAGGYEVNFGDLKSKTRPTAGPTHDVASASDQLGYQDYWGRDTWNGTRWPADPRCTTRSSRPPPSPGARPARILFRC
jgi:hypothetical protein